VGGYSVSEDLISREALLPNGVFYINGENPMTSLDEILNRIASAPAVNAVDRDKLLKRMFPMGIPKSRYEWDYSINAKAVYEAIMKD
jgi:hypothetical protein